MSQSMHRRKFSKQFKIDAVELTLKEEKTVKEIADDLGIRVELAIFFWTPKEGIPYKKRRYDPCPSQCTVASSASSSKLMPLN